MNIITRKFLVSQIVKFFDAIMLKYDPSEYKTIEEAKKAYEIHKEQALDTIKVYFNKELKNKKATLK